MRLLSLSALSRAGLIIAGMGLLGSLWPRHTADEFYWPEVPHPAYSGRRILRPLLLIDQAHSNEYIADDRFLALSRLARRDGIRVEANRRLFSQRSLAPAKMLVIGNALGWQGGFQPVLEGLGASDWLQTSAPAFSTAEVRAVRAWVENGGGLLLAAGPGPAGRAAAELATAFGVTMTSRPVEDTPQAENPAMPGFNTFDRDRDTLLNGHPITEGRNPGERVTRVASFSGQALLAPAGSAIILRHSPRATVLDGGERPALVQGVALPVARGRVVVLGDPSMITAQSRQIEGRYTSVGMNRGYNDNRQFTLNVLHWLAGLAMVDGAGR